MFVLIGSRAAADVLERPLDNSDWDFFAHPDDVRDWYKDYKNLVASMRYRKNPNRYLCKMLDGTKLSFDIDPGTAREFYWLNHWRQDKKFGNIAHITYIIADLLHLTLIKRSHLMVPRNWQKHIEDYFVIKKHVQRQPEGDEQLLYEARLKEVEQFSPTPKINLNVDNKEFFDKSSKAVHRVFEHDDIHKAIKYYDEPLYDKFKTDKSKAMMSKKLFFAASLEDQLRTVREEAYAITLERYIIPMMQGLSGVDKDFVQNAYLKSLERICTTLTKGWFRDFSIEHYPELKKPDIDFVKKFWDNRGGFTGTVS